MSQKIEYKGGLSKEHLWFKEACGEMSKACNAHGRGVIVIPFSRIETMFNEESGNTKSLFYCDMETMCILPAFLAGLDNAIMNVPELKQCLPAFVSYIKENFIEKEKE